MFDLIRTLAVLILTVGIPLQNIHAYAMPFCDHGAPATQTSEHHAYNIDAGNRHEHSANYGIKLAGGGGNMCNACSAPAIVSVMVDFVLDPVQIPPAAFAVHHSLFIPEQLQRPPSQFLA